MKCSSLDTHNPFNIAALLMVDVSPRWLNGHTILDKNSNEDTLEFAQFVQKASLVCEFLSERHVPLIVVEQAHIERLNVSDLIEKTIAICGLYGGLCIKNVTGWLNQKNIEVIQVVDLIIWPPGEPPIGKLIADLFPTIRKRID